MLYTCLPNVLSLLGGVLEQQQWPNGILFNLCLGRVFTNVLKEVMFFNGKLIKEKDKRDAEEVIQIKLYGFKYFNVLVLFCLFVFVCFCFCVVVIILEVVFNVRFLARVYL